MAIYTVGSGQTYATPKDAIAQLVIDQGSAPFTETQTIAIYGGTYDSGDKEIDEIVNLSGKGLNPTATYRLIIQSALGLTPIFDGEHSLKYGCYLTGISYVTIQDIEIKNPIWYGVFTSPDNTPTFDNCHHILVEDCEIHDVDNRFGILFSGDLSALKGTTNSTAQNNTFYNITNASYGAAGIACWYGSNDNLLLSNIIHDCYHGIAVNNSSYRNIIRKNQVYDNLNLGLYIQGNALGGDPVVSEISKNKIYNNGYAGIYTWENGDGAEIINNLIYGHTQNWGYGIYADRFDYNSLILGNTVYNNKYGIHHNYAKTSLTIKNNIVFANTLYQLYINSAEGVVSDYNCLHTNGIGGSKIGFDGSDRTTFANWQSAGYDAHGINEDPLFVDAGSSNFELSATSPCINSGENLSVYYTDDIRDYPRPIGAAFDIGAYEYLAPTIQTITVDAIIVEANIQAMVIFNDGTYQYALPYVQNISDPKEGIKNIILQGTRGDGSIVIPGGKRSQTIKVSGYLFDSDGYSDLTTLMNEMRTKVTTNVATLTLKHWSGLAWVTDWSYTVRRIDEIDFSESERIDTQGYEISFLVISY